MSTKKNPAAKPTKTTAPTPAADKPTAAKAKGKKAPPAKAATEAKGPGVIASIIEFLSAANAKRPLSKADLLAKLEARFPDRETTAMRRTINCQLPTRLRAEKELDVRKNDDGYWIA